MSDWSTLPLSELLDDAKAGFACGEDLSEGVFQFRMNNVTTEGHLDLSKKRRIPRSTRNLEAYLLEPGDVLFNATNSPELVGKSAFFPGNGEPSAFSNHFLRLRPNPKKLEGRFLARWLTLQFQHRVFQGMCRQWVNQATVGRDSLLALRMPTPPLAEQLRISELLDRAEALRAKRRAALAQLDTLTQCIFLDLFGNPTTNSKRWPTRALKEACDAINDCPHSTPVWTEEGMICLRTSNLTDGGWDWSDTRYVSDATYDERSKRGHLEPGDIVLSREGTVGIAAIVTPGMRICMGQRLVQVRPSPSAILPEFLLRHLLYVLSPARIGQVMVGSTSQHLNVKELKALRVPVPPLALQRDFARRVAILEEMKTAYRASLAELSSLFATLRHRAFRGEL